MDDDSDVKRWKWRKCVLKLTPEQEEKARLIILGKIDAQLDYKKSGEKAPAKEGPKNNQEKPSGGPTDAQINAKNKGTEIHDIIYGGVDVAGKLTRASGGEYIFKYNKRDNSWSATKKGATNPSFSGMKNSTDMWKIFSTASQEQYYKQGTIQFN